VRRILVTGGTGQIGLELARLAWPADVELHFPPRRELDLTSPESIAACFSSGKWDCVINSAAYTAVDAAEGNVAGAFLANAQGPGWLAEASAMAGIPMIHISTDYVFDGALDRPYREDDPVGPLGVYGASKLAGEQSVHAANPRSVILRTAWVLSVHRSNFLKTMLRIGRTERKLSVVADQIGCPTGAADIASAVKVIALRLMDDPEPPFGTYHFVNSGQSNWCELARTIFALASDRGFPKPEVQAIPTAEYPTRARRPANSRLQTGWITRDFGIEPRPWRDAVTEIVGELLTDQTGQERI
jgi:dTDP-4-dehydrorhamnose reductase